MYNTKTDSQKSIDFLYILLITAIVISNISMCLCLVETTRKRCGYTAPSLRSEDPR